MALELPKLTKKEKKESGVGKNDVMLKLMDFFDKNPLMKVLIPVLLFIIIRRQWLYGTSGILHG